MGFFVVFGGAVGVLVKVEGKVPKVEGKMEKPVGIVENQLNQ
ncbi:hypothetical protein [Neobacillus niacini]|nr:hypothetical protein [Neobacillus niacini]MDR6999314.1 hypothetical protein [Neobacillus niacini]